MFEDFSDSGDGVYKCFLGLQSPQMCSLWAIGMLCQWHEGVCELLLQCWIPAETQSVVRRHESPQVYWGTSPGLIPTPGPDISPWRHLQPSAAVLVLLESTAMSFMARQPFPLGLGRVQALPEHSGSGWTEL